MRFHPLRPRELACTCLVLPWREWDGARPGLRHELVLHVGDIVDGMEEMRCRHNPGQNLIVPRGRQHVSMSKTHLLFGFTNASRLLVAQPQRP